MILGKTSVSIKDRETANRTLSRLMKVIFIRDGKPKSIEGFLLHTNIAILSSCLEIEGIDSENIIRLLVYSTVFELRTKNIRTLEEFQKILEIWVSKQKPGEIKEWSIVFPINLDETLIQEKRWLYVLKKRYLVKTWEQIGSQYDLAPWIERVEKYYTHDQNIFQSPFIPLLVKLKSEDVFSAYLEAEEGYDLIRSAFNWSFNGRRMEYRYETGRSTPINKIPPAPTFGVFDENNNFDKLWFTTFPSRNYKKVDLDQTRLSLAENLLKYFNKQGETSVKKLIVKAFRQHCIALDNENWPYCYLSLWQILELMAFGPGEGNYSHKDVAKRIRTLLKSNDQFLDDLLRYLYSQRNRLVHLGNFSDKGDEDVQLLKMVVENSLLTLMSIERFCPTWEKLDIYYQNANSDVSIIKKRMAVLSKIEKRKTAH